MTDKGRYDLRGVSHSKSEVHEAIKGLDKGIFPNAFCKVLPDIVGGDRSFCNIMHADTAGTKTSLAYIYWRETGDLSVWEGVVQDAIVMNIDDMGCVGCTTDIILSSTIGRNKHLIPGVVLKEIINSAEAFIDLLRTYGVSITSSGGETADVGDIVRTIDIGYTTFARMKRSEVLVNNIKPGNLVVGLASSGQTTYENEYNGGMGSNGLTSARHDVFKSQYIDKYPASFDPNTDKSVIYSGSKSLTESISVNGEKINVGKLVLSPTRTYLPILHKIFEEHRKKITGMIHCSGGAQAKVLKFIDKVNVIKNNLFDIPPLFDLIQKESGTSMKEMFQVFNMGHRLEIFTDQATAEDIISIAASFNCEAKIIGYVEYCETEKVTIIDKGNKYEYLSE